MSNPAPTLNQINAFNATQGTTIDFNIIGGTEVIRSNKIYIYDLSDNSLICTHLYVSTESIHELPPNTSSSIVYESGKSSADFTNNTQYYAQIQTFTDVGGTQGGSGLSIAKLFWCLPTPTLTLSTIPTTISTTSYNVSATYTPNTSGGATNEIQEFQFNLYSAIGTLLQTSGVVLYGEGVDLSYNFSGLEVDSTYYVTLDVTTTQGMNVSAQSNTFTVSIDTPTMGSASVVNNGCDGYISVTSNLSSEYEHEESAEAGEIMSFTTDSVNDITELDVDFSPVQDGTPWMSTQNTEPYLFRPVPTQTEDFGHESDTIVGGTVAWNQLLSTSSGEQKKTIYSGMFSTDNVAIYNGHRYLVSFLQPAGCGVYRQNRTNFTVGYLNYNAPTVATLRQFIATATGTSTESFGGLVSKFETTEELYQLTKCMLFDLTQMFGSTIADYIYSLETANAGAGVAWLRQNAPQLFKYNAYDAGSLESVRNLQSHTMRGFNQWDEEWENGQIYSTGAEGADANSIRSKNYNPCVPNKTYHGKTPSTCLICWYDADKNFIGRGDATNTNALSPNNAVYLRVSCPSYGTTYNNDICINLSKTTGTPKNGDYVPCEKHSYPLDSDLTLRGILKLVDGELHYDGDVYEPSGSVTREWAEYTIQSADITLDDGGGYTNVVCAKIQNLPDMLRSNSKRAIHSTYGHAQTVWPFDSTANIGKFANNPATTAYWFIFPVGTTIEQMRTALGGTTIVYELATPTTETADPYTNPQIVDPHGTEQYVGSPIPVGHETTYQRICPITGWTGCEVNVSGKNLYGGTYLNYWYLPLPQGTTVRVRSESDTRIAYCRADKTQIDYWSLTNANNHQKEFALSEDTTYFRFYSSDGGNCQITLANESWDYEPFGQTYSVSWQDEAGAVYGGTVDVVSGVLTVDRVSVDLESLTWVTLSWGKRSASLQGVAKTPSSNAQVANLLAEKYATQSYESSASNGVSLSVDGYLAVTTTDAPTGQLVYELATPIEISLTPQQMQTLSGQNNIWSNTNGGMYLVYQLPITALLVKRRDVADVSGKWLTLYSTPITQASDMDFTFIDFLNQYGKTYQYALVPVLAQDQSGVIVQIEGGYTVSDNVDSIFDGVYIADQTNVERVKAGVGYGNIDMNQGVGSITPIGSKYPIVITNSQNQYHNGSIRGTIVPNDFYSNGNLSRMDMVNKRDELEQFLTNKRAKIIKDWNGKMWLVMIMSNVSCSFDDNYGMGMVSFSADWLEVGDPTNQQDLYNAGLINVGGV